MFSDICRQALFGMYIIAEALQNFIGLHAASTLAIQKQVSMEISNQPTIFIYLLDIWKANSFVWRYHIV